MFACNSHVIYTHQKLGNKNRIAFNLYLCDYLCNMYRLDNRRSDNTDVTTSQGDGVQDLTNTFSSNTNLDSSFLRAKSGKQSKTNIKMFKAGELEYIPGFHEKFTSKSRLRCYLCYRNNKIIRTQNYCKKCQKSLCNKMRCWDKYHYGVDLLKEESDCSEEYFEI
ncbi:hypothetical protein CDIK_1245 [Cucumispora dikerogammari]|nr:hypothetical protein CDIK_1245 [Cucumispora dikerogammari]